jgi:hypothetical protein
MSYASHRLRMVADEVLDYEPDVLILYGGHNGFVERRFYADMEARTTALDPLRRVAYGLRTATVLQRLLPAPVRAAPAGDEPAALLGFAVDREKTIYARPEERRGVQRTFEENVAASLGTADRRSAGRRNSPPR